MPPPLIFYHGTTSPTPFQTFHPAPNRDCPTSALGIYLSEDPLIAAEYAQTADHQPETGRILSVLFAPTKTGIISSSETFFGENPDLDPTDHSRFVEARHRLIRHGFDSLYLEDFADNIGRTWIVLCPALAVIVQSHPPSTAENLPETDTTNIPCEYSAIKSLT